MESTEPREITMLNRAMVAGIAESLLDAGETQKADALENAVRCCGEFPECSHILAWIEEIDGAASQVSATAEAAKRVSS